MFYQVKFIKIPELGVIDELISISKNDIKQIILDETNSSHYMIATMPNGDVLSYIMSAGFYKINNYNFIVFIPSEPGYLLSLTPYASLYDKIISHIRNEKIDTII